MDTTAFAPPPPPNINPILYEIDQKHGELSPQAQQAIALSGVPAATLRGQQAAPPPGLAPLATPRPMARGLADTAPPNVSGAPMSGAPPLPMPAPISPAQAAFAPRNNASVDPRGHGELLRDAYAGDRSAVTTLGPDGFPSRALGPDGMADEARLWGRAPSRGLAPVPLMNPSSESGAPGQPLPPGQPLLSGRPLSGLSPIETEWQRLHHSPTPDEQLPFTGVNGKTVGGGTHTPMNTGASGISQIHNPWARIPLQVLDAIGSTFTPRLASAIPGTTMHHNALVGQNQKAMDEEQGIADKETKRGLETAQTGEAEARAEAAKNPKAQKTEPAEKVITTDQGYMQWNPQTERYDIPAGKPGTKDEKPDLHSEYSKAVMAAQAAGKKPMDDPHVQELLEALQAEGKQPTPKEPGRDDKQIAIYQAEAKAKNPKLTDDQAYEQAYNQWTKQTKMDPGTARANIFVQGKPVETLNDQGQIQYTPAGEAMRTGAPAAANITSMMRNAGIQAGLVTQEMPRMLSEIDRLSSKMGPIMGRWNDFMQGKIGMDDPDFAGLKSDLLMTSSAVALAHARGRLPENLREEFDRMINAPKQTPENLKSVLTHVNRWMVDNRAVMMSPEGARTSRSARARKGR